MSERGRPGNVEQELELELEPEPEPEQEDEGDENLTHTIIPKKMSVWVGLGWVGGYGRG